MPYAQTNIQLYSQLLQADWADAELRRVQAAYELAMRLFAGHFRPNQKTFLAHLVGTASILAAHGGESETVVAGLLHSVYSHGEFGNSSRGITSAKRQVVRGAVGDHCEALIDRYTSIRWSLSEIIALAAGACGLSAQNKCIALIKLADVLEDHLERGMQYSPHKKLPGGGGGDDAWCGALIELAAALGHDRLAAELKTGFEPTDQRPVPEFLFGHKPGSFVLAPISHRVRTIVRLGRLFRRRRWVGGLGRRFCGIAR
ncbi:MAG: DUF6817 domain-containing protein [Pirellulales bacterium]